MVDSGASSSCWICGCPLAPRPFAACSAACGAKVPLSVVGGSCGCAMLPGASACRVASVCGKPCARRKATTASCVGSAVSAMTVASSRRAPARVQTRATSGRPPGTAGQLRSSLVAPPAVTFSHPLGSFSLVPPFHICPKSSLTRATEFDAALYACPSNRYGSVRRVRVITAEETAEKVQGCSHYSATAGKKE